MNFSLFLVAFTAVISTLSFYFEDKGTKWRFYISLFLTCLSTTPCLVYSFYFFFVSRRSRIKRIKYGLGKFLIGPYFDDMQDKSKISGKSIYCNPFCNTTTFCIHSKIMVINKNLKPYDYSNEISKLTWENIKDVEYFNPTQSTIYRAIRAKIKKSSDYEKILILMNINSLIKNKKENNINYPLDIIASFLKLNLNDLDDDIPIGKERALLMKVALQLDNLFEQEPSSMKLNWTYENVTIYLEYNLVTTVKVVYKGKYEESFCMDVDSLFLMNFLDALDEISRSDRKCCFISLNEPVVREKMLNIFSLGHCCSIREFVKFMEMRETIALVPSPDGEIVFEGVSSDPALKKMFEIEISSMYGIKFLDFFKEYLSFLTKKIEPLDLEKREKLSLNLMEIMTYPDLPLMREGVPNWQWKMFTVDMSYAMEKIGLPCFRYSNKSKNPRVFVQSIFKKHNPEKVQNQFNRKYCALGKLKSLIPERDERKQFITEVEEGFELKSSNRIAIEMFKKMSIEAPKKSSRRRAIYFRTNLSNIYKNSTDDFILKPKERIEKRDQQIKELQTTIENSSIDKCEEKILKVAETNKNFVLNALSKTVKSAAEGSEGSSKSSSRSRPKRDSDPPGPSIPDPLPPQPNPGKDKDTGKWIKVKRKFKTAITDNKKDSVSEIISTVTKNSFSCLEEFYISVPISDLRKGDRESVKTRVQSVNKEKLKSSDFLKNKEKKKKAQWVKNNNKFKSWKSSNNNKEFVFKMRNKTTITSALTIIDEKVKVIPPDGPKRDNMKNVFLKIIDSYSGVLKNSFKGINKMVLTGVLKHKKKNKQVKEPNGNKRKEISTDFDLFDCRRHNEMKRSKKFYFLSDKDIEDNEKLRNERIEKQRIEDLEKKRIEEERIQKQKEEQEKEAEAKRIDELKYGRRRRMVQNRNRELEEFEEKKKKYLEEKIKSEELAQKKKEEDEIRRVEEREKRKDEIKKRIARDRELRRLQKEGTSKD